MPKIKQLIAPLAIALALGGCTFAQPPEPPLSPSPALPAGQAGQTTALPAAPATARPAPQPTEAPAATAAPQPQPSAQPAPPPTDTPAQDSYPSEPAAVVEAFLMQFQAGPNYTRQPASYLSSGLRAQIRPDHPLNLIMGIQNMYDGFSVTGQDGAAGTVHVRAALGYGTSREWDFALIQEDDTWRIDAIEPPHDDGPPPPTAPYPAEQLPTPRPADGLGFSGPIAYRDPDGVTIDSVGADGGDPMHSAIASDKPIDYLSDARAPGEVLIGEGNHYYVASGGVRAELGDFAQPPRWSPDGRQLAGQSIGADGAPGPVYIYDTQTHQGATLPIYGAPDWYPDGQRLVYATSYNAPDDEPGNVYRYDLGSGERAKLSSLASTAEDRWHVQEAHVLPDGAHIIFYGNHTSEVGASGNGQKWWVIPAEGGEQARFSDGAGNGITAYAASPAGDWIAYAEQSHFSACASMGSIVVSTPDPLGGVAFSPPMPGIAADIAHDQFVAIRGLTWSPDGRYLVYGVQPYTCAADGSGRQLGEPAIYIMDVRAKAPGSMAAPRKIAVGTFPVWVE